MTSRFLFILLLARVGSVVLPVTYKQNKQKLSNLFCVLVVAVKTLPVSVASVSLVPFHLHNLDLHLSSQPHLPHFPLHPHPPLHCHHSHSPALHSADPTDPADLLTTTLGTFLRLFTIISVFVIGIIVVFCQFI